jgi:hypothetical protein
MRLSDISFLELTDFFIKAILAIGTAALMLCVIGLILYLVFMAIVININFIYEVGKACISLAIIYFGFKVITYLIRSIRARKT